MFQTYCYEPILNLLIFLYNIVPGHDLGLAIILLTVIIKLILYPLSRQSIKSQKALQDLQPQIDALKKKYANKKEEMGRATLALYKENKVNPFSSCLPLLVQFPFLIAVFRVFRNGFSGDTLDLVYPFITRPEFINTLSIGFLELSKPNIGLAILAGAAQFWQAKMMMTKKPQVKSPGSKDESMMAVMNKQMLYFMPAITVFIGLTLPGGLSLYWFITTVLMALQQMYMFKKQAKDDGDNKVDSNKIVEGEVVK